MVKLYILGLIDVSMNASLIELYVTQQPPNDHYNWNLAQIQIIFIVISLFMSIHSGEFMLYDMFMVIRCECNVMGYKNELYAKIAI